MVIALRRRIALVFVLVALSLVGVVGGASGTTLPGLPPGSPPPAPPGMPTGGSGAIEKFLYPYQVRFIQDKSRRVIVNKGRQTGFSFAGMLAVVLDILDPDARGDWLVISAGERQAKELARKLVAWCNAIDAAREALIGAETSTPWIEREEYCPSIAERVTTLEVQFANGKRVFFVPANPDTVRGYSCNVFADENAFHKSQVEIMRAVGPATLRGGFRFIMVSTPNGKGGLFYDLFTGGNKWSKHFVPLKLAISEGLDVDYEEMCDLLNNDADSIAQELDGDFLDTAAQFLSPELIAFAESDKAAAPVRFVGWSGADDEREGALLSELAGEPRIIGDLFAEDFKQIKAIVDALDGRLYLGFDIARKRDLSVLWINRKVEGEFLKAEIPGAIIELLRVSFQSQAAVLDLVMKKCARGAIDATGLGAQLAEHAERHFGGKIDAVTFGVENKQDMAHRVKRKLADTTAKVPTHSAIRQAFRAIKKVKSAAGNDLFDADRSDEAGHADAFWACALALLAASKPEAKFSYRKVGERLAAAFNNLTGKKKSRLRPGQNNDAPRRSGGRTAGF